MEAQDGVEQVSEKLPSGMVLGPEEHVLWYGRRSFKSLWGWIILGLLTIWFMGLGLIFFLVAALKWWMTEYVVTSGRVYSKKGLISRRARDAPLEKVTDAAVYQGFMGRILGYGDVRINTAGTVGYEIVFSGISDPVGLRGRITSVGERFKEDSRIKDRLERLEDRYLTGEITREQFESAKRRIRGLGPLAGTTDHKYCEKCGSKVDRDAKFCPGCGARIYEG